MAVTTKDQPSYEKTIKRRQADKYTSYISVPVNCVRSDPSAAPLPPYFIIVIVYLLFGGLF